MKPNETLEKWMKEAELCQNFENGSHNKDETLIAIEAFNNTIFHSAGRILTLAKALQSALKVLAEKDDVLEQIARGHTILEFDLCTGKKSERKLITEETEYARRIIALKPHLEELERLG